MFEIVAISDLQSFILCHIRGTIISSIMFKCEETSNESDVATHKNVVLY